MSCMFSLNTLFWCTAIGFLALYCKIWKVIKSGVQAFNIFLGLFSVFGQSVVTVFFSGVMLSSIMFNQVAFTTNVTKITVGLSKNCILLIFYHACAIMS